MRGFAGVPNAVRLWPAALVEMDDPAVAGLPVSADHTLDGLAARFLEELGERRPGAVADADADAERWRDAAWRSDRSFRQIYGGRAWHRHHVEAFHLMNAHEPPR